MLLRRWRAADVDVLAAINADPQVMEFFPATLSGGQTAALIERIEAAFQRRGYGLWALELPGEAELVGFAGLEDVHAALPCAPAVEIGWRLDRAHWGRGLASEAAACAARFAFSDAGLQALVSTTSKANARSRAVMERLGMTRDAAEDFEHPLLPSGHALAPHVLYRLSRERWMTGAATAPRTPA
ncbi:MAG TPA: GNAT family protein [Solirubrobacteraceae bacterium]|nr:GNAT family protein [Solirubrobacteraceae bacterium]